MTHKPARLRRRGFTLIELMIVVAIIGILSAIAIPSFTRYQLKSRTAEAKTNIGGIRTAAVAFRAEFDTYARLGVATPAVVPPGTKAPWPSTPCPDSCSRDNWMDCSEFACIGFEPAGMVYFSYFGIGLPGAWHVEAVSDLDGDGSLSSWHYGKREPSSPGNLTAPHHPASTCGGVIPQDELYDCRPNIY